MWRSLRALARGRGRAAAGRAPDKFQPTPEQCAGGGEPAPARGARGDAAAAHVRVRVCACACARRWVLCGACAAVFRWMPALYPRPAPTRRSQQPAAPSPCTQAGRAGARCQRRGAGDCERGRHRGRRGSSANLRAWGRRGGARAGSRRTRASGGRRNSEHCRNARRSRRCGAGWGGDKRSRSSAGACPGVGARSKRRLPGCR